MFQIRICSLNQAMQTSIVDQHSVTVTVRSVMRNRSEIGLQINKNIYKRRSLQSRVILPYNVLSSLTAPQASMGRTLRYDPLRPEVPLVTFYNTIISSLWRMHSGHCCHNNDGRAYSSHESWQNTFKKINKLIQKYYLMTGQGR